MEFLVSWFDDDTGESNDCCTVAFEETTIDWLNVTPAEIQAMRDSWKKVSLPNNEVIHLRLQHVNQSESLVLDVKQDNKGLLTISAKALDFCAFTTIGNLSISLQLGG